MTASPAEADAALSRFVVDAGLAPAGAPQIWTPLGGGVSSDIWRVEAGEARFCVKRALGKLRVADDWRAPVGRNLYEWRWLETAAGILPAAVPRLLAADHALGAFAMEYLDEATHPVWKRALLDGRVDVAFAGEVGARLVRIHAATAGRADLAAAFPTDDFFMALRLDPYLLAAGRRQPGVAAALDALVARTAHTHLALAHGDISPKNILAGPSGPIFLDAETAWYGDPAFDLAFCLNHLLLKRLVAPHAVEALSAAFDALAQAYLAKVDWEAPDGLEARAASLLPGLLLARVDGKSPVEYLTDEADKARVRAVAMPLLLTAPTRLAAVRAAWET